jgi:CheY-like chemotaxis protein
MTKTILIIEQEQESRSIFLSLIHEATLATDSLQALQILTMVRPDLLLVSDTLPQMTGIELYNRIQRLPSLQHLPPFSCVQRFHEQRR